MFRMAIVDSLMNIVLVVGKYKQTLGKVYTDVRLPN